MIFGIYDHYGGVLAQATTIGKLAITEADLNAPTYWNSLGDFKAQIQSHRCRRSAEGTAPAVPQSATPERCPPVSWITSSPIGNSGRCG